LVKQQEIIDFCREYEIVSVAYSPLGSPTRPWVKPTDPALIEDPKLKELAKKYNKSVAQIVLRYQVTYIILVNLMLYNESFLKIELIWRDRHPKISDKRADRSQFRLPRFQPIRGRHRIHRFDGLQPTRQSR